MTVEAYGTLTGPADGSREFVFGATPLNVGDVVRVTGYGYGATLQECGKTGTVSRVARTRVDVTFDDGSVRRIGGACLAKIETPSADEVVAGDETPCSCGAHDFAVCVCGATEAGFRLSPFAQTIGAIRVRPCGCGATFVNGCVCDLAKGA